MGGGLYDRFLKIQWLTPWSIQAAVQQEKLIHGLVSHWSINWSIGWRLPTRLQDLI